jgi:hypothetical protein
MSENLKVQVPDPRKLKALEARMRAPKYTGAVFLGRKECLLEGCDYDRETLRRIGKSPEDISSRLSELTRSYEGECMRAGSFSKAGYDSYGGRVLHEAGLVISGVHYTTYPEFCPFGPEVKVIDWSPSRGLLIELDSGVDHLQACAGQQDFGRWDFFVERADNGERIFFGDLVIHLIEAHHFFEGQVTKYRLDPLRAAYVLGIIDEKKYTSEKSRERLYDPKMQTQF